MVDVLALSFTLLLALTVIAGLALVWKTVQMEHRKEMKLIEEGRYPEDGRENKWVLAIGLILVALGAGRVAEAYLNNTTDFDGITVALLGLAALLYYFLTHYRKKDAEDATTEP